MLGFFFFFFPRELVRYHPSVKGPLPGPVCEDVYVMKMLTFIIRPITDALKRSLNHYCVISEFILSNSVIWENTCVGWSVSLKLRAAVDHCTNSPTAGLSTLQWHLWNWCQIDRVAIDAAEETHSIEQLYHEAVQEGSGFLSLVIDKLSLSLRTDSLSAHQSNLVPARVKNTERSYPQATQSAPHASICLSFNGSPVLAASVWSVILSATPSSFSSALSSSSALFFMDPTN